MKNNKIIILGSSCVGKTSMINYWIKGIFHEKLSPTIGSAYNEVNYEYEGQSHKIQIWDTAGEEKYRSMAPIYARNASAAIVVFSVDKIQSLKELPQWISCLEIIPNAKVYVVGNKKDREDSREVTPEQGQEFAKKYNAPYFETSAMTGEGIEPLFSSVITKMLEEKRMLAITEDDQDDTNNGDDIDITQQPESSGWCGC